MTLKTSLLLSKTHFEKQSENIFKKVWEIFGGYCAVPYLCTINKELNKLNHDRANDKRHNFKSQRTKS